MDSKILIVSIFYNRAYMVDASVQSLVSQLEPDMHLLLFDDGSSDDTLQRLQAWSAVNVTVMTHPNRGFVHTLKTAIDIFPSTYIAIHGSGDLSLPGRFRKQADYLDQHADVGLVGCHSRCIYSHEKWPSYVQAKSFSGDARRTLLQGNLFHHGEVMMRRDCYTQVGGYRTFFTFAQDRDLFCRLSQITQFHIIPEVLYSHFLGVPGSVSGTASKVVLQRFLSDFACYCHARRLAGLPDPLLESGPSSALTWSPSSKIRTELFRRAMRALYFHRREDFATFRQALLQKGCASHQRLLLKLGATVPTLIQLFLNAYYGIKQVRAQRQHLPNQEASHHAVTSENAILAGINQHHS